MKQSRKTKKPPCTPGEVFDFCWILFVRVKALCQDISDDLVNSYHLLLSCVDHIYACAIMNEREDLLNEKFTGVVTTADKRPCVVDALCSAHDGIIKEVKAIREHWWRRRIRELFDSKVLKGDNETLTGLLELGNFEHNLKSIRKEYEAYVLSIGEYDERVFLGNDAEEDIGSLHFYTLYTLTKSPGYLRTREKLSVLSNFTQKMENSMHEFGDCWRKIAKTDNLKKLSNSIKITDLFVNNVYAYRYTWQGRGRRILHSHQHRGP